VKVVGRAYLGEVNRKGGNLRKVLGRNRAALVARLSQHRVPSWPTPRRVSRAAYPRGDLAAVAARFRRALHFHQGRDHLVGFRRVDFSLFDPVQNIHDVAAVRRGRERLRL
jgi:hypothetical protein